jgi:predicted Rossmann fold flavoprotein
MKKDLIVIGAGASGIMAAISAARDGKSVLLLEKMQKIGLKLKASGGGRCNLTNRLDSKEFMESFGRDGRFMQNALKKFDNQALQDFFEEIGVKTDSLDGFRVFPVGHNSQSVLTALESELNRLNVKISCKEIVNSIKKENNIFYIKTENREYSAKAVIIATGGAGYPQLGSSGDGYKFAKELGHRVTKIYPAMMPLKTKERWVANCRANTLPKVTIKVDIKKYKKLQAKGDLIFTKDGIRGPVVLDFSREITPLLDKFQSVPVLISLTNLSSHEIYEIFKKELAKGFNGNTLELVQKILPKSVAKELILEANCDLELKFNKQKGANRDRLLNILAWTPLTIIGHNGFDMAMVTRGGVNLKDINPNTLESRVVSGLYFCGEVINLDGPCGGFNLQWAFTSGFLAGKLKH